MKGWAQIMEGKMFLDKRAHNRILVKLPVSFKVLDEKRKDKSLRNRGDFHRDAESWDTSLGGMYLVSEEPLRSGEHLSLKISIPHKDGGLTVLADVVWADDSGAGLRFIGMKDEEIRSLEDHLKSLSRPA
jgi:hypothetical protein